MCDNCRNPKERTEGKEDVLKLLNAVIELKEMQRANHICSFLYGENTTEIKSYKHDLLPSFAAGKDKDKVFWNAVIRQSLVAGLISKDIETYGVIKMTERGQIGRASCRECRSRT